MDMWFAVTDSENRSSETAPAHWLLLLFDRLLSLPSLQPSLLPLFLFQECSRCLFVMDCVIPIRLGAARAVGSVAFVKDWQAFKRKKREVGKRC